MLKNLSTMIEDKLYSTFTAQEEGGTETPETPAESEEGTPVETPETPAESGVEETPVETPAESGEETPVSQAEGEGNEEKTDEEPKKEEE